MKAYASTGRIMSVADPKCFVRLKEPIPGVDHINFIDQREFADAHHLIDTIASQLGVDRINDFYVYKGEHGSNPVKWHTAAEGLDPKQANAEGIFVGFLTAEEIDTASGQRSGRW
jgi:hypothetical protein